MPVSVLSKVEFIIAILLNSVLPRHPVNQGVGAFYLYRYVDILSDTFLFCGL